MYLFYCREKVIKLSYCSISFNHSLMQNEIYFSLASTATLNPQAILKLCKVSSEKSFKKPNDVSLEFTTKAKKKASADEDDEPVGLIPNNYVEEVINT